MEALLRELEALVLARALELAQVEVQVQAVAQELKQELVQVALVLVQEEE
jgi:hypothetical protein